MNNLSEKLTVEISRDALGALNYSYEQNQKQGSFILSKDGHDLNSEINEIKEKFFPKKAKGIYKYIEKENEGN